MESFHIPNSHNQNCQNLYELSAEDLANIPCPDDSFPQAESSPSEDDIELPLPPGTSGDDFLSPLSPKQHFFHSSNNIFPSLSPNKAFNSTSNLNDLLVSENLNILALHHDASNEKSNVKSEEYQVDDASCKLTELLDDSKYSPSKIDSDDENQDFITLKPKVLGKEQAKKRLMAFSLSKQPSTSVKKQSKTVTPAKNKEKPPNPNKSSNVQEQFRATISAIEEEKKKMFQNMPSYLLLEMSELAKSSHTSMSSSLEVLEKLKSETTDSKIKVSSKNGSVLSEKRKSKKSFHNSRSRSRSQSKSKKRRRSRSKRRSRSRSRSRRRSKRSLSRSRRRSHSRSRRSTSHNRRFREENNFKTDKILRESQIPYSKKLIEDWNSFKSAGLVLESESWQSKNRSEESKSRREEYSRRSRSPNVRLEFKPIFNYLTKGYKVFNTLQAKPANPGNSVPVLFSEKIIKYTRTKPILCWAENPSIGTDYYMSKQMLLENCDETMSSILLSIIENKSVFPVERDEILESQKAKSRFWYPQKCFFLTNAINTLDNVNTKESHQLNLLKDLGNMPSQENIADTLENKEEINFIEEEKRTREASLEKKISLVNDSYLSEEEDKVKEMIVGDVKVQLDLDMNSVKVRSKWDSDYEPENSEKELTLNKEKNREKFSTKVKIEEFTIKAKEKLADDFDVASCQPKLGASAEKKEPSPLNLANLNIYQPEAPNLDASDATTGNLVSEYEEFLKMVSVESNDHHDNQKKKIPECKPNIETPKVKKPEKSSEENQKAQTPKFGLSEWDQESDHEEKSSNKKLSFIKSHDEFLILGKNEKLSSKLEKSKKKPPMRKTDKTKLKKKKLKKYSKAKKKCEDSITEDSTSESYDSDSDSDSDESISSKKKKKKKKKVSKSKKKCKKQSSSDSDSDSDDSSMKRRRLKKKKGWKKRSSSSNDSEEETQNALLKQLDFKKQLIMKKIEEIDSISDRSTKKKEKEIRAKRKEKESSEETESENYTKSEKKKKGLSKVDKKKAKTNDKKSKIIGKSKKLKRRKSSSDSESDSESSEESVKKKKNKKPGKKKQNSSDSSSDSEEKPTKLKLKSSNQTLKKNKKSKRDSSLSESDDSENSLKNRKKSKKKGSKSTNEDEETISESIFKENFLLDDLNLKPKEQLEWESKKLWKKSEGKNKKEKEDGDWEASSSVDESQQKCKARESSWDEETEILETKTQVSEDSAQKADKEKITSAEKDLSENNSTNMSEENKQLASETLKTSLSNFSFNENSFCSFGQELSRDFFLAERSYSNSGNLRNGENIRPILIEPRPFQSVSKDSELKKPADSELYSPGYSDSDLSEVEINKSDNMNIKTVSQQGKQEDVYDPLNCDSEGSGENNEIELSSIPLPCVSDILLPGEAKNLESVGVVSSSKSESTILKNVPCNETDITISKLPSMTSPLKSSFVSVEFTPIATSRSPFTDDKNTPTKRQLMSVKGQQKLISKAASVFQDESDEENVEPLNKLENIQNAQNEISENLKEKVLGENECKKGEKQSYKEYKNETKSRRRESRDRSSETEKRRRSRSREKRGSSKIYNKRSFSPNKKRRSRTPEICREKREIRSDSFEIEPLKSSFDSNELTPLVQPIPVLMGVEGSSSEGIWNRSIISGCEFTHGGTDNLIDNAESFDIYPPEESKYRNRNYDKNYVESERAPVDNSRDGKNKEKRRNRSQSSSPKRELKSKSPEKRKSPRTRSSRRKSVSPKREDKSPFSPRKRSPKRKSPPRRYKSSRSPDHKRKSCSKSPRKKRNSPSKRSRSVSPRKYWSPKIRDHSPKKRDSPSGTFSPRDRFSPQKDSQCCNSYSSGLQNRIPVIGASSEGVDMELSPSAVGSPFENTLGFHRQMVDSTLAEADMYNSFYEGEYTDEFGVSGYSEEVGVNNLITVKSHEIEKGNSPERLSLDQRIELELRASMSGSQTQNDQYQMSNQACPSFQEINSTHFQNSYSCENTSISNDNYYQNPNAQINSDFNGQYFNGHQQQPSPSYGTFQQYPNSQPVQNSVLQISSEVGNIVEVVPALQHPPPPPPPLPSKAPQIMQVGNVLQVVPSQKATPSVNPISHNYGLPEASPIVKTQKATAVVAPSSIVPTPSSETILNPLIKAIQMEREKRRKEKEKRKAEREARRKARQLRREAKLMSVNEKLKKSVQNEGLMLGQEVEDDDLLDALDVPSPPIPVEIITVSSPSVLPPAGKGILITAGFMPKPPSEKKEVKFADGVCPGEGTSTSGGEDVASPPPKPALPKEKRFKKKKTKVKKKVKVQIIRQIVQEEEDDDEDDLSPPPPPPGDPPPVFFARFPFAGDAQFPVYQTQTTTTTLTTIQYPAQSFE